MAGNLQIPGLQGSGPRGAELREPPVPLLQQRLADRPVELQKVDQPAIQVRIAAGTAQREALQQPQGGVSRQPAVLAHPAVDAEQGQGQSPSIQADRDQMGQRALWPGTPEQMQMAVFARVAMAVVVALAAAARIPQVARGVMLVLHRDASAGEGLYQRPVAFDQAEPVIQGLPCRSRTVNGAWSGVGIHHTQREGPQPPS